MTAEEVIKPYKKYLIEGLDGIPNFSGTGLFFGDVIEAMKAFAKYHVKEALEEAKYAAELVLVEYDGGEVKVMDHIGEEVTTNKVKEYITINYPAILEAYPESKIK